jgi:hypothetical protein
LPTGTDEISQFLYEGLFSMLDMPQLLCRPIDQSGNLAIKLGEVRVSQSVLPAAVWTEGGRRLARVLASRSVMDWRFHRLAGSATW